MFLSSQDQRLKKLGFYEWDQSFFFSFIFASPFVCFISLFVFVSMMHLCVTNSLGFYLRLRFKKKNRFRFAF